MDHQGLQIKGIIMILIIISDTKIDNNKQQSTHSTIGQRQSILTVQSQQKQFELKKNQKSVIQTEETRLSLEGSIALTFK